MNILDFIACMFAFITIGLPLTFSLCWMLISFCYLMLYGDNRK